MDQDVDGDGAINLSTSQRPSAATTPNDSVHPEDVEQVRLKSFNHSRTTSVLEQLWGNEL